jgi:Domain of unknown function (DUF4279)
MIWYSAQLRIEGTRVETARITEELGMKPTLARQVGDRRDAKSTWEKALWALDAANDGKYEWETLEAGLSRLLTIFSPYKETLLKYKKDHEVYFYCGQFSAGRGGGPHFSEEILKHLGDFGIPIHLQVYFSDDES